MNLDVAKAAIAKAEAGDPDGAEANIVNHYDAETVQWQLQTLMGIDAFRPRMSLADKALIDYQEQRYHACVPIVLALLDGLVNELHEKRRGFFSQNVDLQAWDSIAAHEKGLTALAKIFKKDVTRQQRSKFDYRIGTASCMEWIWLMTTKWLQQNAGRRFLRCVIGQRKPSEA